MLYRRPDGSFAELGSVACSDLKELFVLLQGERWSPRGEARELIISLAAGHTSMSVGDRVVLPDGRLFEVAPVGFREVAEGSLDTSDRGSGGVRALATRRGLGSERRA